MCSLKTLATLLAAASVASAAPVRLSGRQTAREKIAGALSNISGSVQQLDISIRTLTPGDANSAAQLTASAEASQRAIEDAAVTVRASDDLTLFAARRLEDPADALVAQVRTVAADLAAKKPAIEQMGMSAAAAAVVQKQKAAVSGLSDAMLSKIPRLGQDVAKAKFDAINSALDGAVVTFAAPAAAVPAVPAVPAAPAAPAAPTTPAAPAAPASPVVPAQPAPAQPAASQPAFAQPAPTAPEPAASQAPAAPLTPA